MTLPEQGGFNERLDEVLERFRTCAKHEDDVHQAFADECITKWQTVAAIRTLVLEEIIGETDHPVIQGRNYIHWVEPIIGETINSEDAQKPVYNKGRNDLRAEQCKKLGGTHGTK